MSAEAQGLLAELIQDHDGVNARREFCEISTVEPGNIPARLAVDAFLGGGD
jgi:hypothetical protein